jgi:hypothetical protein
MISINANKFLKNYAVPQLMTKSAPDFLSMAVAGFGGRRAETTSPDAGVCVP